MIQHSLPQNITAYQFRLIGDMTIKQFILLSLGIAGAIFFYYTNLFSPLKWLFVIMSGMTGFALAFMPFEDRPLDQWITNYLHAIYRPTRFIWRKNSPVPAYFNFTQTGAAIPADSEDLARTAALRKQQGLRSFLITLPQEQNGTMDQAESSSVAGVLNLFNTLNSNELPTANSVVTSLNISLPTPPPTTAEAPSVVAGETKSIFQTGAVGVVTSAPTQINKSESQNVEKQTTATQVQAQPNSTTVSEVNTSPAVPATTASTLPFPSTPSIPNTVVGMVLDSSGKIVENAIIEVADEQGLTARATKTNQLGQFFSTTPLKSGTYRISIEKLGLNFDTIELGLTGRIVEPLKIQAKASA